MAAKFNNLNLPTRLPSMDHWFKFITQGLIVHNRENHRSPPKSTIFTSNLYQEKRNQSNSRSTKAETWTLAVPLAQWLPCSNTKIKSKDLSIRRRKRCSLLSLIRVNSMEWWYQQGCCMLHPKDSLWKSCQAEKPLVHLEELFLPIIHGTVVIRGTDSNPKR